MAITLLEMLQQAGLLTAQQLDDALQHRVFYGGKIGTNLVELGFLREEDLARFLSRKLGVPYVPPEALLALSATTIALLPRELALKYKVIPLALDKKRLSLAMADPADLAAIDDIAFITGFVVKPLITPEFRLMQALGQYYQMELSPRYQRIIAKLASAPPPPPPKSPAPRATPPPRRKAAPTPPDQTQELPPQPAPPAPTVAPDWVDDLLNDVEELEEVEIVDEGDLAERVERYATADVSKALARVEDREEIAAIVLDYLAREVDCTAMFIVRGDVASGWRAIRKGREVPEFDLLHIPFARDSVLKTVTEGKSFYLGPLVQSPLNQRMLAGLQGNQPRSVLLLPMVVMGRVLNILYLEGGPGDLADRVQDVQKLLSKAALAFEILICRERILLS